MTSSIAWSIAYITLLTAFTLDAFAQSGTPCERLERYETLKSIGSEIEPFWIIKSNGKEEYVKDADTAIAILSQKCKKSIKLGVRLGMTTKQVLENSSWGTPEDTNTTINHYGRHEQWVYKNGGYLYFDNGKLTTIQN